MEFLVHFDLTVPPGTPAAQVTEGESVEASAAAELADAAVSDGAGI